MQISVVGQSTVGYPRKMPARKIGLIKGGRCKILENVADNSSP
jgi:hypothetical protein